MNYKITFTISAANHLEAEAVLKVLESTIRGPVSSTLKPADPDMVDRLLGEIAAIYNAGNSIPKDVRDSVLDELVWTIQNEQK